MTNKIVCEKCSEYAEHHIDSEVDGILVSLHLCEKHYWELRKEKLFGPLKAKTAALRAARIAACSRPDLWRELVEVIHAASPPTVIVVTGGGSSAISELLSVPGGSRTLLEAVVPYSEQALVEWLGKAPEHFCVEETALAMAMVAYRRGCALVAARKKEPGEKEEGQPAAESKDPFTLPDSHLDKVIGVACTASLVSDRPKKGGHRCHVATQTESATASYSLVLEKGVRDRPGEERLVGKLVLLAMARALRFGDLPALSLRRGETVLEHFAIADPLLVDLLDGRRAVVWSVPNGTEERQAKGEVRKGDAQISLFSLRPSLLGTHPFGVLCGSFHPLHYGHKQLREVAERILKGPVYYEMSIRNVDKPPLDFLSIDRRRAQFTDVPLVLTAAPTFAEKAAALPGVVFVVGVDTAERIVQPRYYGGSEEATRAALQSIHDAGCRFLVAGRKVGETFQTLSDIPVPPKFAALFADLFAAIRPEEFRADISSTQLRHEAAGENLV
ncbi:MAG: hypothetical protein HY290_12690 [Planctomycetia bacterium]|nr:hypothetical protein [Planctomycetia bacterium]